MLEPEDTHTKSVHLFLGSSLYKTFTVINNETEDETNESVRELFNFPEHLEFKIQDFEGNFKTWTETIDQAQYKLCFFKEEKFVPLPNEEFLSEEQALAVIDLLTSGCMDVIADQVSKRKYKCNYRGCRKSFDEVSKLKHHFKIHNGDRPHRCSVCGKGFTTKGHLKSHENTHLIEKPYICSFENCGKSYAREQRLNIHLRTHTGNKPYICKVKGCGKSFAEKGNLKTHIRTHTGEKPYCCNFQGCERSFTTQGHLTDHKRRHTGERPFQCCVCGKSFMRSSTMKTHMKRHKLNEIECVVRSDQEMREQIIKEDEEEEKEDTVEEDSDVPLSKVEERPVLHIDTQKASMMLPQFGDGITPIPTPIPNTTTFEYPSTVINRFADIGSCTTAASTPAKFMASTACTPSPNKFGTVFNFIRPAKALSTNSTTPLLSGEYSLPAQQQNAESPMQCFKQEHSPQAFFPAHQNTEQYNFVQPMNPIHSQSIQNPVLLPSIKIEQFSNLSSPNDPSGYQNYTASSSNYSQRTGRRAGVPSPQLWQHFWKELQVVPELSSPSTVRSPYTNMPYSSTPSPSPSLTSGHYFFGNSNPKLPPPSTLSSSHHQPQGNVDSDNNWNM